MARARSIWTLAIGVVVLLSSCAAPVPSVTRVYRVGYLSGNTEAETATQLDAFRQALRDLGYVAGQNLSLEVRYADGRVDRDPGLAAELVALKLDVIAARATPEALALRQATSTIPIVLVNVPDVVESGLAASLAHPGGNITGTAGQGAELAQRRLQLLKEALPGATRVTYVGDATQATATALVQEYQKAGAALGIDVEDLLVRAPADVASAFDAMRRRRPEAVIIAGGAVIGSQRQAILDFVSASRLPSMFTINRESVDRGGLLLYGADLVEVIRRSATYVDRILKGAKAADLPIEKPSKFEFIINLKTAKALGLTIPQSVIAQATEVIQ
jgi:putative ABC transport system substrate-binding protein